MSASIDGSTYKAPWLIRLLAPMFKRRILTQPMQPGVKIPAKLATETVPDPGTTTQEGLTALREAITRLQTESKRAPMVGLGPLTHEEHTQLHLRHAEMHLSFVWPVEDQADSHKKHHP